MKKYKVKINFETTVKAENENEAEEMAVEEANFGNADIETEEVKT